MDKLFAFVVLLLTLQPAAAPADDTALDHTQATSDSKEDLLWYDVARLGIEGKAWNKTKSKFDRLPARAEETVRPPVWSLSRDSAGMAVRFKTDATRIAARWKLISSGLAMPHMPATGVSGLDLYVKADDGRWHWLAVGRPTKFPENRATLANGIPPGEREFILYLPLYNGVSSVEIGIAKDKTLKRLPRPAGSKPIVFYGTSITQGGCASRPGMVYTAILGRRLNHPVVNLGFSGNGRMEKELAELMAEIDAAAYVIDCLPNIAAKEVAARTEPLVHILRQAHPETPIMLVEDRSYADSFLVTSKRQRNESSREELRAAFKRLQKSGVKGLYYLAGEHLLGDDGEATVDSSHPTDLGFVRMADAFEPVLRKMLSSK